MKKDKKMKKARKKLVWNGSRTFPKLKRAMLGLP